MIVIRSENIEKFMWHVRSLLPQIESTPITLAKKQVDNYVIALGTLGYIYTALASVMETLVEARRMANDFNLRDYTVVIGPEESYITTTSLPELTPPLPQPREIPPLPSVDIQLNTFGCGDLKPGLVRFCIDNVEIAYGLQ